MSNSSLSTVVSSLVRASMGTTVSSTVTDEELDRHVAELILKEAKQKAERYLQDGVRAYLPDPGPDANLPKANKRFLSAIIRNTDDHNKAILRAQAEAAQEVRAEREEQERNERRARAKEATDAERLRRLMGGSSRRRHTSWDKNRDINRRRSSRDTRSERDGRYEDGSREHRKRRRSSRSPSRERRDADSDRHRRRKRHVDEDRGEGSSRTHRRHSKSRSPDDKRYSSLRRHEHSRKSDPRDEERETLKRTKGKDERLPSRPVTPSRESSARITLRASNSSKSSDEETLEVPSRRSPSPPRKVSPTDLSSQFRTRKAVHVSPPPPASPTLSEEEDIERLRPRRRQRASPDLVTSKATHKDKHRDTRLRSPSPKSPVSKMDKYFEASYDPRLDTGPLVLPSVPATGLINGSEFESWDAMLDIIRQRREDKVERKRMERLGMLPDKKDKERQKDGEKKIEKGTDAWNMDAGTGIMDIKYSKKGAVREWDMGKEGF